MATILILTANPLLDHITDRDLEPGVLSRIRSFSVAAGGKGLNAGRVLVRHGHRVLACGFAGGYTGSRFTELVAGEGQTPIFIPTAAPLRVGFLAHDCAGAGTTGLLEGGFPVSQAERAACIETVTTALRNCDLAICAGSIPDADTCTDLYAAILERCTEAGVPCWVDSYGPAMEAALAGTHPPALVKPNRQEWEQSRAWARAGECHITNGPEPIEVAGYAGRWQVVPPAVTCVNPVGCGDCYLGALAHARLAGWSIEQQLCYAAAAGSHNATSMTVGALNPSDIAALTQQAQCRALPADTA